MDSYSDKSSIDTIVKIEQSFDVNSVMYNGLSIWPLIRLFLWQRLPSPRGNLAENQQRSNDTFPMLGLSRKQRCLLETHKNVDILFFSSFDPPAEYAEEIEGKIYSPFIDSMIDFVKANYTFLKMEMPISELVRQSTPRFEPSTFISPRILNHEIDTVKSIKGFSGLHRVISDICGIFIDEAVFLEQGRILRSWQQFFGEILSVVRPRAVFLVCYYHLIAMSLINTCKKKRIPTVDIQHGARGAYQALYTHWTKVPQNGYELLPDYFWCWGRISKENIEKWYPSGCRYHQPVVGGNLRIAQYINKGDGIIGENEKLFFEKLKKHDKVILVAMTLPSVSLPGHVLEVMRQSPSDWIWLIRLHPYHRNRRERNLISNTIIQLDIHNADIEFACNSHLYDLLKMCDHHITFSSSTCYEALLFDVPTTFIHSSSFQAFGDDINSGIFTYADTSEALLASIKRGSFPNPNIDPSEYIETDRVCADDALRLILNHSFQEGRKEMAKRDICKCKNTSDHKKLAFDTSKDAEEGNVEGICSYSNNFLRKNDKQKAHHERGIERTLPSIFTIETVLGCNLSCPECAVGGDFVKRKKGWMIFDQFKVIADKIRPFCRYLNLHNWGEPLLNEDIFKMIQYARSFTKTNISTNGQMITEEKAEKLIFSGVTDIIVSIDGVSQGVYEKYRRGGDVRKAINALRMLQHYNEQYGSKVNLIPQFIVFKHNEHEMEEFNGMCLSLGLRPFFKAPYLRSKNPTTASSDVPQYVRPTYPDMSSLKSVMRECQNVKVVFTVLLDGTVVVCCHDYGGITSFGNIFKQSVEEIWDQDEYRVFRSKVLSGEAPAFCIQNCMTWFLDESHARNEKKPKPNAVIEIEECGSGNKLNNYGESLFAEGKLSEAISVFFKATKVDPENATAHNNLGVLYWQKGEDEKALVHFGKAMEIDPGNKGSILGIDGVLSVVRNSGSESSKATDCNDTSKRNRYLDVSYSMNMDSPKINLCGGPSQIDGYINVDMLPQADITLDLEKDLLPFADDSVNVVVCNSAINYFERTRALEIIKDVFRVLAPGGIARFGTLDLRILAEKYLHNDTAFYYQKLPNGRDRFPGKTIGDKFNEFFYGFRIGDKHGKYIYDFQSLKVLFVEAGFSDIQMMPYCQSLIPEVGKIDNRPEQMFFLEAIKGNIPKEASEIRTDGTGRKIGNGVLNQGGDFRSPDLNAIRERALSMWEDGHREESWQLFMAVLESQSDDRVTVLKCADILSELEQFEDLQKLCENYLKEQPEDTQIQHLALDAANALKRNRIDENKVQQKRFLLNSLYTKINEINSDEEHLAGCVRWLRKAQTIHPGGGVSSLYRMDSEQWGPDYPETTGYIIPTFICYYKFTGDERYLDWAIEMGDWEISIQRTEGGVGEPIGVYGQRPRVFNTSQVILGWAALYRQTGQSKYLNAAQKAANWLIDRQDPDGKWTRNTFNGPKAYMSRVAWAFLELFSITGEEKLRSVAEGATQWVVAQGNENGWFRNNSFYEQQRPWTHVIGYVLVGLLKTGQLNNSALYNENAMPILKNAAEGLSNAYHKVKENAENGNFVTLPGTFDDQWFSIDSY